MNTNCFNIVVDKPITEGEIYVGEVNGLNATTVSKFLSEIAKAFEFPDYFGNNLDALDECINDLSWIDSPNYILYISNYNSFLKDEDPQTKLEILALFRDACNQWSNVPNFEGEDEFRKNANFVIHIERCEEINNDLKLLQDGK